MSQTATKLSAMGVMSDIWISVVTVKDGQIYLKSLMEINIRRYVLMKFEKKKKKTFHQCYFCPQMHKFYRDIYS